MSARPTAVRSPVLERVLRDFRSASAGTQEAAFAQAARARAASRLSELGWPALRDEQWRYANLRAFEQPQSFQPPPAATDAAATLAALGAELELPAAVPGFERLLYLDGVLVQGEHAARLRGVAEAEAEDSAATLQPWPPEQRLGLLCDMFATDAARFSVRGEASLEILFLTSSRAAGRAVYPHLQLKVERASRLTLIERHLSTGASGLVACNVSVELGREATLTHYRLQQCGRQTVFTDTLSATLADQSRYNVRSVAVGAGTARTSARVQLLGRGAALAWQAIAIGRGEQVHDVALKVEHGAPGTVTEELFRGIADERARVAFSGHIHIAGSAPGSQAHQSLRGLIEGSGAEIDLRPRLEILTDEVRATHGATTGRLDENLLFYMLSRGIDRTQARALLKWAFLGDVLRQIELPGLRAEAERAAAGQLPDVPPIGALS